MTGGGSGGGTTHTTSTTTQELSPEQRQLFSLVIPKAEQFINQPLQLYPGSTVAGFDPLQQAGREMTVEAAQGLVPQVENTQAASNFLLGPVLFPESNPALRAATDAAIRPVTENFTENILPALARDAISAGGYGGTRQSIAEGLAGKEVVAQSGDIAANLANQAYQQGLNAMVAALSQQPQLFQAALLPGTAVEAVGAQGRQLEQARLTEAASKFMNTQILPFLQAQEVASLAAGIPGGTVTSNTVGQAPGLQGPSPLQYALSGLSLLSLFL